MATENPPGLGSQPPTPPLGRSYNEQSKLNDPDAAVLPALATPHPPPSSHSPPIADNSRQEEDGKPVKSGNEAVPVEVREDQKVGNRDTLDILSIPPLPDHHVELPDERLKYPEDEMTQELLIHEHPTIPPSGPIVAAGQDNLMANPKVAELKGIFPDFDAIVLQSVLDSVNGNQERAIEVLLGMSDPNYVPSPATAVPEQYSERQSVDVDEQLARQIAMEEEQVHRDGQQVRSYAARQEWQRRDAARLQAQAFAHAQNQAQYQGVQASPNAPYSDQYYAQQGGQRRYITTTESKGDFVSDVADTISSIAESGRKTFVSLFGKAKARIDEYNARPAQRPQQYPQQGPYPNQAISPSSTSPPPRVNRYSKPPPPIQPPVAGAPLDRHAASEAYQAQYFGGPDSAAQQHSSGWEQAKASWTKGMTSPSNGAHDPIAAAASGPSLYAPNSSSPADEKRLSTTSSNLRGYDVGNDLGYGASTQRTPSTGSTGVNNINGGSSGANAAPPATVQGFDVRELGYALPGEIPGTANPVRAQTPVSQPRASIGDVPAPPRTSTGSPIDPTKIGLLPKRAVSLLPPKSASPTNQSRKPADDSSDDDELEYLENPFEDERR